MLMNIELSGMEGVKVTKIIKSYIKRACNCFNLISNEGDKKRIVSAGSEEIINESLN